MNRPTLASRRQLALALDGEAVAELRQQPAQDLRDEVVKVLAELLLEALGEPGDKGIVISFFIVGGQIVRQSRRWIQGPQHPIPALS